MAFTESNEENAWKAARDEGKAADDKKDYATAEAKYQLAVSHARHIESNNPHHLAETLTDLADTYRKEGKTSEARATYQEVIQVAERISTAKSASVLYNRVGKCSQANAWLAIGNMYEEQKNDAAAEEAYKEGLKLKDSRSGMLPVFADLKKSYADVLERKGKDPALVERLREEVKSATDEAMDGL